MYFRIWVVFLLGFLLHGCTRLVLRIKSINPFHKGVGTAPAGAAMAAPLFRPFFIFFIFLLFFFKHTATKRDDLSANVANPCPDRGLLQNQKSMYTEMAPNAWECLQLASIFEFFSRGRVMFVPDRSIFLVFCRIKKSFIVVTVH